MSARAFHGEGLGARGLALAASFLLPSVAPAVTNAPPAAEFFNRGAVHYIRDRMEPAKSTVQEGLAAHPDDPALQKLKILLEQPPQQQQQQQDQQQQQEQKQEEEKNQQQQQQNQQDQQEQQQQQEQSQDQRQEQPQEPEKAEEMTPEEAKMMLDQLAAQEEKLRDQIRNRMARPVPVDKDW